MSIRRRVRSYFRFRAPEQLEERHALGPYDRGFFALGIGWFDGRGQVARRADGGERQTAAAYRQVFSAIGSLSSTNEGTKLTATLTDASGTGTGTATYKTYTSDGETETEFKVSVTGATPGTFDVLVGEVVVGQITIDDTGAGSLVLSSNPTDTEVQLPADFPAVTAGTTAVTIGTLSGTLATATHTHRCGSSDDTSDTTSIASVLRALAAARAARASDTSDSSTSTSSTESGGCHAATVLTAALTDETSSATGTATLKTYAKENETSSTLTVSITGAAADQTLDVVIDNTTTVGQITTDSTGAGKLVVSSGLPTITAGTSTISIGSLSGTFATSTTSSAAANSFVRLSRRR